MSNQDIFNLLKSKGYDVFIGKVLYDNKDAFFAVLTEYFVITTPTIDGQLWWIQNEFYKGKKMLFKDGLGTDEPKPDDQLDLIKKTYSPLSEKELSHLRNRFESLENKVSFKNPFEDS